MTSAAYFYDHAWLLPRIGLLNYYSDAIKVALVTSSYTFSAAHTQWSQASSYEVASGSGYTTGGVTLSGVSYDNSHINYVNPSWTALTKTFRGAIFYKSGTTSSPIALTNPLIAYLLFDTTPQDIVNSGSNFAININSVNKLIYKPS